MLPPISEIFNGRKEEPSNGRVLRNTPARRNRVHPYARPSVAVDTDARPSSSILTTVTSTVTTNITSPMLTESATVPENVPEATDEASQEQPADNGTKHDTQDPNCRKELKELELRKHGPDRTKPTFWFFLLQQLMDPSRRDTIVWTGRGKEFRIKDEKRLIELWSVSQSRQELISKTTLRHHFGELYRRRCMQPVSAEHMHFAWIIEPSIYVDLTTDQLDDYIKQYADIFSSFPTKKAQRPSEINTVPPEAAPTVPVPSVVPTVSVPVHTTHTVVPMQPAPQWQSVDHSMPPGYDLCPPPFHHQSMSSHGYRQEAGPSGCMVEQQKLQQQGLQQLQQYSERPNQQTGNHSSYDHSELDWYSTLFMPMRPRRPQHEQHNHQLQQNESERAQLMMLEMEPSVEISSAIPRAGFVNSSSATINDEMKENGRASRNEKYSVYDPVMELPVQQLKTVSGGKTVFWLLLLKFLVDPIKRGIAVWTGRGREFKVMSAKALGDAWFAQTKRKCKDEMMQTESVMRLLRGCYKKRIIVPVKAKQRLYAFITEPSIHVGMTREQLDEYIGKYSLEAIPFDRTESLDLFPSHSGFETRFSAALVPQVPNSEQLSTPSYLPECGSDSDNSLLSESAPLNARPSNTQLPAPYASYSLPEAFHNPYYQPACQFQDITVPISFHSNDTPYPFQGMPVENSFEPFLWYPPSDIQPYSNNYSSCTYHNL